MTSVDLSAIAAVTMLVVFLVSVVSFFKALYHGWFVGTGIRQEARIKVFLQGPFVLLRPSSFNERARQHLRPFRLWLAGSLVLFGTLFVLRELAS